MKKFKLVLWLFSLTLFAACVDIEEIIDLNANGSGNYSLGLDLAKTLEFAKSMNEGKESKKPQEKKDTLIYLRNSGDAFNKLSAEEKELFKDAFMRVNLDEAAGKMKILMSCPFRNMNDLAIVKKQLPGMLKKLDLMDKAGGKTNTDLSKMADEGDEKDLSSINPGSQHYSFTVAPGKISYLINDKEALKNIATNDSVMQVMQQVSLIMGDMTTTTIINLPAPVKSVSNPKAQLSDDKKTVTVKSIITEVMEKPEEAEYTVEY